MASRAALLLLFNVLFFTLVSSTRVPCPPTPKPPSHGHHHHQPPSHHHHQPPSHKPSKGKCPKDTLKLRVCGNLLNDLMHVVVGKPPKTPCCTLIHGLVNMEAAVCLCTAIKANVLGINLEIPVSLSLLLNYCGKKAPSDFQCA